MQVITDAVAGGRPMGSGSGQVAEASENNEGASKPDLFEVLGAHLEHRLFLLASVSIDTSSDRLDTRMYVGCQLCKPWIIFRGLQSFLGLRLRRACGGVRRPLCYLCTEAALGASVSQKWCSVLHFGF